MVATLVAITLTFSLVQVNNVYAKSGKPSFDNHEIKHGKQKVYGARINRTERKDVKNLDVSIRNLDVTLDAASASVAFEILGAKVNFNLDLYEGNITYGENNQSIIGIPKNASQNYNISCFRIEKYADLVTLMEPNMDLEGKVTLYLGVNKTGSDDVIYLQEELKNIEFDEILNSITNFRGAETNNSYTTEELREIECLYLFGTSATSSMVTGQTANQLESSTNSSLSTSDLDLLESFKNGNYEYTDNSSINTYSSTATYASLYPTISDSIFTSFTSYNKWTHVKTL